MSTNADHVIRWTFDDGSVNAEAVCRAATDADCRLAPKSYSECQCEAWGEIQRRADGTIWHALTDGYRDLDQPRDVTQWHEVVPGGECNVELFINESGCAEELTPDGEHHEFVLAETAFDPVWENDGCSWRPLTAPRPAPTEARQSAGGGEQP